MYKCLIHSILIIVLCPVFALNRDYATFIFEKDDNKFWFDDVVELDSNNDLYGIYYYEYCIEHFNKGYLPYYNEKELSYYPECFPTFDRELLYLIPLFQIPGVQFGNEFICYVKNDKNELCRKPIIYPGYLDFDFHKYNPFLEEQLVYFKNNPSCKCYWPEYSKEAGRINDIAYVLFSNLFTNSALSQLIKNKHEQARLLNNFLWNLNLHGLSVSCVCRSFWFSHYFRICEGLLIYAKESYQDKKINRQQLSSIHDQTEHLLLHLAKEFAFFYQACLEKHISDTIEQEIDFIHCLYPEIMNFSKSIAIEYINIPQKNFDHTLPIDKLEGEIKLSHNSRASLQSDWSSNPNKFWAEFHLYQGLFRNDILDFKKAIESFDKSLKYDNRNKLTYLARAYANFELQYFDQAIADYAIAKTLAITPPLLPGNYLSLPMPECALLPVNRIEFSKGFIAGGMQGFNEGAKQFIPSILHTITGIGQGLWHFSRDPVSISQEFMEAIGLYIVLAKDCLEIHELEQVLPEMNKLLGRWDSLTDFEKGKQIGFVIGKYGIDIFLAGKTVQLARSFREAKYANGALTLEVFEKNKQRKAILEEAERKIRFRKSLFRNGKIKLHEAKQKKHMHGPDYVEGKSPINISMEKLKGLCSSKAGTGEAIRGSMGEAGYRERIDFGEYIGECIYQSEEGITIQKPTTMGIIHYDAEGNFHVVPARPKK